MLNLSPIHGMNQVITGIFMTLTYSQEYSFWLFHLWHWNDAHAPSSSGRFSQMNLSIISGVIPVACCLCFNKKKKNHFSHSSSDDEWEVTSEVPHHASLLHEWQQSGFLWEWIKTLELELNDIKKMGEMWDFLFRPLHLHAWSPLFVIVSLFHGAHKAWSMMYPVCVWVNSWMHLH